MTNYYTEYYLHQSGGGVGGHDSRDDNFLQLQLPRVYQRGRGVGAIFSTIFKFLKPLLKSGAKFLGKEALTTGVDVIKGIANQKPIKEVLTNRSLEVVDKIRDNTVNKIKSMRGSGIEKKRKYINRRASKNDNQFKTNRVGVSSKKTQSKKIRKRKKSKAQSTVKTRILDIFSN